MKPRGFHVLLGGGAAALIAACATAPRVPPPELVTGADSRCPLPLAWPSPALTPRRIRIENRTELPLVVVIEGCFRLQRLTELPPGATLQPLLPQRMIAFPEGIRFHAFVEKGARYVGSWYVAPTPGPILDLVLDTAARATGSLALFDQVDASAPEGPQLQEDPDGSSYLMVPGVAEGGLLIWSCGNGRRWLSVSTGAKMSADTVGVALRYDRGDRSPVERWEVLASLTDAVLAPEADVDSLTVRMLRARLVNVEVDVRPDRVINGRAFPQTATTFAFSTEDLTPKLAEVSCFKKLAARITSAR